MRQDLSDSFPAVTTFAIMGMLWAAFAALVPVLKSQIGASDSEFGLILLVASIGAMGAMWLAPRVDAAFGSRSLMVVTIAMGATFVLPGVSHSAIFFTGAVFLMATTSGVMDVLMNARISEVEARTNRPLMSLNHSVFSFAYGITAILTGLAREAGLGPVPVFGTLLVVTLALSLTLRMPHSRLAEVSNVVKDAGMGTIVWLIGFVVLAALFAEQAVEGWSALHLERTLDGGASQGAIGPAVLGLTMGVGRLFGQVLIRWISDSVMIGLACLISAVGMCVAGFAPTLALAYLGFALTGLGISVVIPLAMALVGRSVPEQRRVAAIGQVSVIGYVAFLIGPVAMGMTADAFGLPYSFLLVAGVLICVAVIVVPTIARRMTLAD